MNIPDHTLTALTIPTEEKVSLLVAPASDNMKASGSGPGATSSQASTSAASHLPAKRGETEAQLAGRSSPPKKQQVGPPTDDTLFNLSTIIIVIQKRDGSGFEQVALDEFSEMDNHSIILRPKHFSYFQFRMWAEQTAGIPKDEPIQFAALYEDGSFEKINVSSKHTFMTMLTKLWTRTLRPVHQFGIGNMLRVVTPQRSMTPAVQPPVQVEQPEKPKPEAPPKPLIDLTTDEPEKEPVQEPNPTPDPAASVDGLTPLPADEFLKVVQEAETPDDASLLRAIPDEPDADSRLYKFDPIILKKALLFFDTNINGEGKCSVKRLRDPLHIWQIYTAYEMFTNPVTVGVNGLAIGLGVGFGKTRLTLLYLRARARILHLKDQVDEEWKTGVSKKHLLKDRNAQHARCPSQDDSMVQCPCSWDSDTREILNYMSDLPALIIGPSSLRDTWMHELEAAYVDYGSDRQLLNFYWLYGQRTSGNDLRDPSQKRQIVKDTQGLLKRSANGSMVIDVGNGTSQDVFLCGSRMANKLLEEFKLAGGQKSLAAFGAVIMDEVHNYKGTEKTETLAFKCLATLVQNGLNPITLFIMCGTLVEEGPSVVRAAIKHYKGQWDRYGPTGTNVLKVKSGKIPAIFNNPGLFAKYHHRLLRAQADGLLDRADMQEKSDKVRGFLQSFVRALRQDQLWRGRVLNPLPKFHEEYLKTTPLDDAETAQARKDLAQSIDGIVAKELKKRKKEWLKRKEQVTSRGERFHEDEPTKKDVIEGLVDKQDGAWLTLARASTYPSLLVLENNKLVDPEVIQSAKCQPIPASVQAEIDACPGLRHVPANRFEEWDFFPYAEQLRSNSPKLGALLHLIDKMIHDTDPGTEPPKNDPCRKRHAIVYHEHPVSAVLTYFFLITDPELCQKIQAILFTSAMKLDRRREIMKEMVQSGRPDDRCKILIASTDIAAEGFNVQRVNNIWFMELPTTASKYLQARGRALRTGQEMKVNIVSIYDEENLLETTNLESLSSKRAVSELIYNIKTPETE